MTTIIGWDLGGANIKAASAERGRVQTVVQIPCPILASPEKFNQAVAETLRVLPPAGLHAVTMTGELSDVFASRAEGVAYLVAMMRDIAAAAPLRLYAGSQGFVTPDAAAAATMEIASANWHATAALVGRHLPEALVVDVGTTTTDIVPVKHGRPGPRGFSDGERLAESELVYCGIVRTPVMAIAQRAPFKGRPQRLAAERFATMADVFRLTGELPEDADPYPTADQRAKSQEESAARLARMLGRDAADAPMADWITLARYFADCELAALDQAARTVADREALTRDAPIVGAGCGRFLAEALAMRLGRPYIDFADLIETAPQARHLAAICAPAVAVALLAEEDGQNV
jgi:probable H4MPT-linked C1 transfer pathway protein